mmetsp:Transcript_71837/g.191606  ORF Transcript_71837/g.191606 Transcript_71837/m.191606 type:complete len:211 (+) Transcript_71837:553-1185(+)
MSRQLRFSNSFTLVCKLVISALSLARSLRLFNRCDSNLALRSSWEGGLESSGGGISGALGSLGCSFSSCDPSLSSLSSSALFSSPSACSAFLASAASEAASTTSLVCLAASAAFIAALMVCPAAADAAAAASLAALAKRSNNSGWSTSCSCVAAFCSSDAATSVFCAHSLAAFNDSNPADIAAAAAAAHPGEEAHCFDADNATEAASRAA